MKKAVALILLGIMFLSITPGVHTVKSASSIPSASITGSINLNLGDKVKLGPFEIEFVDTNVNMTQFFIKVRGPQGTASHLFRDGESWAYPSADNVYLNITVYKWIGHSTKAVLLEIRSPLQRIMGGKKLLVGESLTLPEGLPPIKVKLVSTSSTDATFSITLPYGETRTLVIEKGDGGGVSYRLDQDHYYANYLYLRVLNVTKGKSAVVDIYVPRVAATDFKIIRKGQEEKPPETPVQTVLVYNDILYTGEKLPVEINGTTYYISLRTVTPIGVSVEILRGKQSLGTMILNVGDLPKPVPETPLKLSVQEVEPDYHRAKVMVYAPAGAKVTPILRPANILVTIDAIPKEIMIDDNLVVTINVKNLGRGDAYDVNVAAPIPDDFELVSMTKSWTLKNFPAFTSMPALIYVLKPTKVGEFEIGRVIVTFYDDKSLETGKKRVVYSQPLTGVKVYAVPAIDVRGLAYNGTWASYVTAKVGDTVRLKFEIRASGNNPDFEFIKNATLVLDLPETLDGPKTVKVGTVRAGEAKTVGLDVKVIGENLTNVRAVLVYLDPLGNRHSLNLGNLVTINSIPPRVIIREVKVWPTPEELPEYVNRTLAQMENPQPLAEKLLEVSLRYLPERSNPWKPLAIFLLVLTLALAGVAYRYWDEAVKLREKLERRKQRRPGGLPKKEEELPEEIQNL
ncbi:BatD family protein [Thermococcus sp.]|uniref:BatD family protein n=1 Tax=Thermococcus sp. TaxID=35749 RepID=UPI0026189D18|nr:BatD family protein [Thermococcus sp.]